MKILKILLIAIAPAILMAYGWILGQRHQSGYDVAGILLFFTGLVGLVLGLIIRWLIRKVSWANRWYANLLIGIVSCTIVFGLVLVYAQLHG